jgi:hypothetical protein
MKRFRWITIQDRQLGAELGTGDILVLAERDRCTSSMTDGISIIERVHKRGVFVKVLDRDYLDLTKPINRGILALPSALAEDERHCIVKRANEGPAVARTRGTGFGRNLSSPTTSKSRPSRAQAHGRQPQALWGHETFTLRGPTINASHAARCQNWREAPLLGLTGLAEFTLRHGRVVAEEVAYDLNMACETLRGSAPNQLAAAQQ